MDVKDGCALFWYLVSTFMLQSIGFFVPNWVTTETCDAIGLFYRCCGKNDTGCTVDGADTCKTFLFILKVIKIMKKYQQCTIYISIENPD